MYVNFSQPLVSSHLKTKFAWTSLKFFHLYCHPTLPLETINCLILNCLDNLFILCFLGIGSHCLLAISAQNAVVDRMIVTPSNYEGLLLTHYWASFIKNQPDCMWDSRGTSCKVRATEKWTCIIRCGHCAGESKHSCFRAVLCREWLDYANFQTETTGSQREIIQVLDKMYSRLSG